MDLLRSFGAIAVALTVGLAYLLFVPPSGGHDAPGLSTTQVVESEAGRTLYLRSCAACHGPSGQGTAQGPSLIGSGAASADFMLRTGRMPFSPPADPTERRDPAFDDEQIRALVAYVGGLGGGPAVPDVVTSAADIPAGRALYQANCAQCHGPSGAGVAIGGGATAPSLRGSDPRTVVEAMRTGPNVMPVFPPAAIDDGSAAAIAAYVQFLQDAPSPGGVQPPLVGPVTEGFIAVVIGLGVLVLIARSVAPGRGARESASPDEPAVDSGPTDDG